MAKRLLDGSIKAALVSGLLVLTGTPSWAQDKSSEAWQRLSRLQCLIEYFYMETGVYPLDLQEMDQIFRQRAPRAPKPVGIPIDPATNQPFVYKVETNGRKYSISVPDPSKYGGAKIALSTVDWGYLADLADLKRFSEIVRQMQNIMKVVATQVEMYAKDHGGQYPNQLDDLLPKYVTRMPSDPLTGKNLAYKKLVDGYIIGCPNPEKFGMKTFHYSSTKGIVMEQAARGGDSKAPAPKEEPKPAPPKEEPKTDPPKK
jgi:hypothetical protein